MKELNIFNYKKNRLQQIKGFFYTARFRSISKAARALNLTQSTVTLQVQSLERDLNLKLLNRNSKPLTLTAAGEDFYKVACPIINEFESIIEKFLSHQNEQEQTKIDIAVHHIAISYLMPRIIAFFKKSHPNSNIAVRNLAPDEALKRLKEGTIDLALYPNLLVDHEIKYTETISYDPILIVNKNHPLAKMEIKSMKDLKKFDLIRIDKGLISLPFFEEVVNRYNLTGSIEFENGNWEMLKSFVKENNFAAIISEICFNKNDTDLVAKNLGKFFPTMNYSIAVKNGKMPKPIVQNMVEAICATTKKYKSALKN